MLKPEDLKPADYNPRVFSDEAAKALEASMKTFNDISGITYNTRTGNIVGGHHRWENLVNTHGIGGLKFKAIKGTDRLLINDKSGEFTGYILRKVDWDEATEKAANITANSSEVEGTFTSDLQLVLADIRDDFESDELFSELRLDALEVNIEPIVKEDTEDENVPVKKSETMISGGGDKYITVKMELSPDLSDRLYNALDRFKSGSDSVERSLDTILTYIENTSDSAIMEFKPEKKKRSARKRRK